MLSEKTSLMGLLEKPTTPTTNTEGNPGGGVNNTNNSVSLSHRSKEMSGNVTVTPKTTVPLTSSSEDTPDTPVTPKLVTILPPLAQCTHTPFYCEENIWKLCDRIQEDHSTELDYCHVAFISNPKRMVPLWRQKSGKTEEKLALWDYHVILLYNPDDRCVVYDMDSDLPFPTHFHKYVTETFRTENILQPEYHRFFRVLPVSKFMSLFSSDRSHMRREDGTWAKPPPTYAPICRNGVNNLQKFLDMTAPGNEFGELFNLMELVRRFYKPRQLS